MAESTSYFAHVFISSILQDKFANFNKELDELAGIQKFFAVPDSKLRDRLRKEIIKMVVPQYTTFHSKYLKISFSKNPEKYIKYSPEEVTSILDKFFDPTALTRPWKEGRQVDPMDYESIWFTIAPWSNGLRHRSILSQRIWR